MSGFIPRVVFALAGGALFSQSAEFTQQYLQRLGGAADELRTIVRRFDEGASAEQISREEAIARLKGLPDRLAARQGLDAETSAARFDAVERRYAELTGTAPLFRPFAALADPDPAVAGRTFEDFRPALPVTPDGLALAFIGFVVGWAGGAGLDGMGRAMRRRRRATPI